MKWNVSERIENRNQKAKKQLREETGTIQHFHIKYS